MTFDRFFKVSLLVVLSALAVSLMLRTEHRAEAQGGATTDTGTRVTHGTSPTGSSSGRPVGPSAPEGVGRYQVIIRANEFFAVDTTSGEMYDLVSQRDSRGQTRRTWQRGVERVR